MPLFGQGPPAQRPSPSAELARDSARSGRSHRPPRLQQGRRRTPAGLRTACRPHWISI